MTHITALVLFAAVASAQDARPPIAADAPAPRAVIAADADVKSMTLVKSSDGKAVVRFGDGTLQLLAINDRVGRTRATVTGIVRGRLVLDEVTAAADGKPLRAQIVLRDGETGGKRYQRHPGVDEPIGTRPEIVEPAAGATRTKKPGSSH